MTRDRAAIVAADAIDFIATASSGDALRRELRGIIDVAAVADEFWVAAGDPPSLHRFDLQGECVQVPLSLSGSDGALHPTAAGPTGVLWSGSPPTMMPAEGKALPINGDHDCIVPISLHRWLVASGGRVALRDPSAERWAVHAIGSQRAIDGAALFEGRTAALLLGHGRSANQLLVLGVHDGAIHHRVTLTGIDLVRFAPARGLALFVGAQTLTLFDLRFGRVICEHDAGRDIVDATLDSTGQAFALRHADAVVFGAVRDLIGGARASVPEHAETPRAQVIEAAPQPVEAKIELPSAVADFHRGTAPLVTCAALAPRVALPVVGPAAAIALLDAYRPMIAAFIGRAIARAWDAGRLTFLDHGRLPFRDEVAGILGRTTGLAPDELDASDRETLAASEAVRAAEASIAPGMSPLAALAEEFGLSTVAQLMLLLVAAPSLWGELTRLYGILGNDEQRALVDEQLLIQILDGRVDRHRVTRELDDDAPLLRHGFLQCGGGRTRPFGELTCEPIVLRILRASCSERDLADVRVVRSTCAFDDLLIPGHAKDALVAALAAAPAPGRFIVRGRTGSGRHTVLAILAATANRALGVIDAAPIVRDVNARIGRLRAALYRTHLLGLLPCVDGLETLPADDRAGRDHIASVLDEHPGPLAVRLPWNEPALLRPGHTVIDLPALSHGERRASWDAMLHGYDLFVRDPDELSNRFSIGPGAIARACERVAAVPRPAQTERSLDLEVAIRRELATRLGTIATRVTRLATWSRVVLAPDIQESVLELIARIKHRRTVFDAWGFDRVVTTARGVTALFQGGPGTGKTLVASAIASELGMDLYRVDLSRILSKWIGETEQNLAKLFDAAEDGHAIILFDEADSLFAKRTEVKSSVDRYANAEVNYLLQRLDSFEGIAILTTNFGTAIDRAFKRRLSFRLTLPFPDEEAREALWRSHLPPELPRLGDLALAELARRYQLSGGYIRNAALRAAFLAVEERSPLTRDHLERAIRAEFREIGKISESGTLE